jgi:hypothetical protein
VRASSSTTQEFVLLTQKNAEAIIIPDLAKTQKLNNNNNNNNK